MHNEDDQYSASFNGDYQYSGDFFLFYCYCTSHLYKMKFEINKNLVWVSNICLLWNLYITYCITLICKLLQPNFSDNLENGARLRRTLDPLAEKDQRHRVTFWFCCFFLFCVFEMDFLDEFCHYASPNYCRHTPRGKYYFLFWGWIIYILSWYYRLQKLES